MSLKKGETEALLAEQKVRGELAETRKSLEVRAEVAEQTLQYHLSQSSEPSAPSKLPKKEEAKKRKDKEKVKKEEKKKEEKK